MVTLCVCHRGPVLPTGPDESILPITTMMPCSKGFITVSESEIRVYEHTTTSKSEFSYARSILVNDPNGEITAITLTVSEEFVFCLTTSHQIYTLPFISNDPFKEQAVAQSYLVAHFHRPSKTGDASITGIDTCFWKPLLGTLPLNAHITCITTNKHHGSLIRAMIAHCLLAQ